MGYETKYETDLANKPLQKISKNVRYQNICAVVTADTFRGTTSHSGPNGWGVPAHCLGSAFLQGCGEIPILFDYTGAGDPHLPKTFVAQRHVIPALAVVLGKKNKRGCL